MPDHLDAKHKTLAVNTQKISTGKNNKFFNEISFNFDMINYKVAHLTLSEHNEDRFNVPDSAVPKPNKDTSMRLEALGFNISADPFYFEFKDVTQKDNWYVTTKDMTLYMTDKFMQVDFLLPSQ